MKRFWNVVPILFGLIFVHLVPASAAVEQRFRNTYYYAVLESAFSESPADSVILDMNDTVLARVSAAFKKALSVEGTGKLLDGRVINFGGRKNGETRYRVTQNPFGDGIGKCALIPFHTIAVDPKVIPLGSVVRIAETAGMKLPDGSIHDGLWHAEDIGSAIQNDRIDLFVGYGNQGKFLADQGITHLQPLTLSIVTPPDADTCAGL